MASTEITEDTMTKRDAIILLISVYGIVMLLGTLLIFMIIG